MKSFHYILALALLGVTAVTKANADQIVFQANFNVASPVYPNPPGPTVGSPDDFTVQQGSVYYLGGPAGSTNPCTVAGLGLDSGSTYCLQLPNVQNQYIVLNANATLGPGSYRIVAEMAGGLKYESNAYAEIGNGLVNPVAIQPNSKFAAYQWQASVDPGQTSSFTFYSTGFGALLDSITVTQLDQGPAPIPEPTSWQFMLGGSSLSWYYSKAKSSILGLLKEDLASGHNFSVVERDEWLP